jgi:curved DNA-binding protein
MTVLDYYSLLEIKPDASNDEIKKAFRHLAQRYHPDGNNQTANKEMFLRVKEAYSVLSNPTSRLEYDKAFFREPDLDQSEKKASAGGQRVKEAVERESEPQEDAYDDSDESAGVAAADRAFGFTAEAPKKGGSPHRKRTAKQRPDQSSSGFSSWFTMGKTASPSSKSHSRLNVNDDRVYQVSVDVLESLQGAQREVVMKDHDGTYRLKVKIPAGITNGTVIHVRERPGDPTDDTMIPIRVTVTSHPFLRRAGLDLHLTVPVTIAEAFKGAEIEVPTYKSVVRVKIPPLTKSGAALRLKNKGIEDSSGTSGDFYVKAKMEAPSSSSQAAIDAAEEMEALYEEPVRKDMPKKLC